MPVIAGEVWGEVAGAEKIHVGAFSTARIQRDPVAWTRLDGSGPYRLSVPKGNWYMHGVGTVGAITPSAPVSPSVATVGYTGTGSPYAWGFAQQTGSDFI